MGKYYWHDHDGKVKDWRWVKDKSVSSDILWHFYLDNDPICSIRNAGKSGFACFAIRPTYDGGVVNGFKTRTDAALFALHWRKSQLNPDHIVVGDFNVALSEMIKDIKAKNPHTTILNKFDKNRGTDWYTKTRKGIF